MTSAVACHAEMPIYRKRKSHLVTNNLKKKLLTETSREENSDFTTDEEQDLKKELHETEAKEFDYTTEEALEIIGELYALCAETVSIRYLSTLLYMTIRHVKLSWRDTESKLKVIGTMSIKSCYKWSQVTRFIVLFLVVLEHAILAEYSDLRERRSREVLC